MGEDFLCQADDGNSGDDGVASADASALQAKDGGEASAKEFDSFAKLFGPDATAAALLLHLAGVSRRLQAGDFRRGIELAIEEGGAWLDGEAGDDRDNMQTLMEQVVGLMNGHYCLIDTPKRPIGIVGTKATPTQTQIEERSDGPEAEHKWEECGFGICEDCGAGLIDDFPCLRCKWEERRRLGLANWRPCNCHLEDRQVCDLCQGVAPRIRGQLEEPGTGDEVDPAGGSASLTPHEAKAREITAPYDSCLLIGSDMRDLIGAISSALLTVQKQERERCAKIAYEHWKGTPSHQLKVCRDTCANIAAIIRQGDDNAD